MSGGPKDLERDLRERKREAKKLREHLTKLTQAIMAGIIKLDEVGARKDLSNDAGKLLAAVANYIEVANDSARYFGLGIDFRTDKKPTRANFRIAGDDDGR